MIGDAVTVRSDLHEGPDDCHPGGYLARRGDEIETLQAEIAEMQAALLDLIDWMPRVVPAEGQEEAWETSVERACKVAGLGVGRAALAAKDAEIAAMRESIGMAYGHLWCVNEEPTAPVALYSNEKAAYAARKLLRDSMTSEQRGTFINRVVQTVRKPMDGSP